MGIIEKHLKSAKRTFSAVRYGFNNTHEANDLHVRVGECDLCNPAEAVFCSEHKEEINSLIDER